MKTKSMKRMIDLRRGDKIKEIIIYKGKSYEKILDVWESRVYKGLDGKIHQLIEVGIFGTQGCTTLCLDPDESNKSSYEHKYGTMYYPL